jgi:hypothetical protein
MSQTGGASASTIILAVDPGLMLPFLVLAACLVYLSWLARRTARSLTASGVPIKGWKGMPAWLIVEVLMLLGCFVPVAFWQLWERGE